MAAGWLQAFISKSKVDLIPPTRPVTKTPTTHGKRHFQHLDAHFLAPWNIISVSSTLASRDVGGVRHTNSESDFFFLK